MQPSDGMTEMFTLLQELTAIQRQRLSGKIHVLAVQGVGSGDAWAIANTIQRQEDMPGYEPTREEQQTLARARRQIEGQAQADLAVQSSIDWVLGVGASATSASSSGGVQAESAAAVGSEPTPVDQLQAPEPPTAFRSSESVPDDESTGADDDDVDGADGAASDTNGDQNAQAQDILDNARRLLDTGAIAQSPGESRRAENGRYVATSDPDGVITVQNRETGGYVIGDGDGNVSATEGLSPSDQQAWRRYAQVHEAQLRRQERQPNHTSDLEL